MTEPDARPTLEDVFACPECGAVIELPVLVPTDDVVAIECSGPDGFHGFRLRFRPFRLGST